MLSNFLCRKVAFGLEHTLPSRSDTSLITFGLDKERPYEPKKRLQARLLFRIAASTDRTFTNKCMQHTHAVLFLSSLTIAQAHWNTQKYQTQSLSTYYYTTVKNRTISQACNLIMHVALVLVKGRSNQANQQDTLQHPDSAQCDVSLTMIKDVTPKINAFI